MSPGLRRAFHQALDLVLDALAEEEREAPKKRKRPPIVKTLPVPEMSAEDIAKVDRQLERAGYRKTG